MEGMKMEYIGLLMAMEGIARAIRNLAKFQEGDEEQIWGESYKQWLCVMDIELIFLEIKGIDAARAMQAIPYRTLELAK